MKFFPTLLDFIDMGFECFVWVMRYPISEDVSFGQALVFFLFIFLILSFAFKTREDISSNYRLGSTSCNNKKGGK